MKDNSKSIIEAVLFSAGRQVEIKELSMVLEKEQKDIINIVEELKEEYDSRNAGFEIIKVNDSYQMCTRQCYYDYVAQILDKRYRPNLSNASLEILSIIAYNPNITRAQIETIRGVNSDGAIYKLLEYELIKESGRLDAPGRPTMYVVSDKFFKMFGISSLDDLPELPRYKLDENQQIVIDDDEEIAN